MEKVWENLGNIITIGGLRLDIDNDINAKIINVIARLFDSLGKWLKRKLCKNSRRRNAEKESWKIEKRIIKKSSLFSQTRHCVSLLPLLSIKTEIHISFSLFSFLVFFYLCQLMRVIKVSLAPQPQCKVNLNFFNRLFIPLSLSSFSLF